jgi:hypothetical protein
LRLFIKEIISYKEAQVKKSGIIFAYKKEEVGIIKGAVPDN